MSRIKMIIIVSISFVLGQLVVPLIFGLLNIPIWITYFVEFISIMPIPIIMVRDLVGIPHIRIIAYAIIVIPISSLLMNLTAFTIVSPVAGYALFFRMSAIILVFGVGFVVYHYLNFSKRGAVFIILFAVFTYLEPILGSFSTLVSILFRVLKDYSDTTQGIDWNIIGPMGVTTIYTYIIRILAFIFLVIGFDGLMQENKLSNY